MAAAKSNRKVSIREKRLAEAIEILTAMQFGPKQRNETAAYTLLAVLDLKPDSPWEDSQAPLCGITTIIDFIANAYKVRYAPNTRETIRDDAVKFFVEEGLFVRNPDNPNRLSNRAKCPRFTSQIWNQCLEQRLARIPREQSATQRRDT